MKRKLHPAIEALKEEIHLQKLTYDDVARISELPLTRLKNLMSGRARLSVEDRDRICKAIGISPGDMIVQRADLHEGMNYISVKHLSPELRQAVRLIVDTLTRQQLLFEHHVQRAKRRAATRK